MRPGGVGLSGPALRAVRIEFSSPLNTEGVVVLGERGLGGDRSGQVFELCPLYHLRTDPTEKLEALAVTSVPMFKRGRFRAPDKLIAMLNSVGRPENYVKCFLPGTPRRR